MKTNSKDLLNTISNLITVGNSVLPIIKNYLFDVQDNVLSITTTDLENTTICSVEVTDSINGKWCVPFKFREVLSTLKNDDLELSFNEVLTIKSEQGEYQLPLFDASEFPSTPETDGEFIELNYEFISAIQKTAFATGNDELRPIMTGVSVRENEVCATDAHKLAKVVLSEKIGEFIIPKKACGIISKLDSCKARHNGINLEVVSDNFRLISKTIDGKFPNYNAVIPNESVTEFTTNRIALIQSIKRVALFSNKTTNLIEFNLSKDNSFIKGVDNDHSQKGEEKINGTLTYSDIRIGFNAKMLLEILNNLEEKEITLNLIEPNRAVTVKENNMLNLLMPVMI